jgi:hypothetical protein
MNHGPVGFINLPLSGIHNYQENFDGAKSSRRGDDTGQELGLVMQFYEWGPAYALLDDCRLGPHDTFEEAQAAVEDPKKAKPLAYFSTSKLDDV